MRPLLLAVCLSILGCADDGDDPCISDHAAPSTTRGCNGPIIGAEVPDNAFGGACIPGPDDNAPLPFQGSCAAATDGCAHRPGATEGTCLRRCDPAETYVSTGGCPRGSRCFTVDAETGNAYCYPDCVSGSDCVSGMCDSEGGCVP